MKNIKVSLSRKGFDSGFGGMPSPILPDGTLLSLPIQDEYGTATYEDLRYGDKTYLEIIEELKPDIAKKLKGRTCHVDPDLRCAYIDEAVARVWNPAFGQRDQALKHLQSFDFGVGDIFLFYGWFRKTKYDENGRLRFLDRSEDDTPDRHVIFGYMEVGEVLADRERIQAEYGHHPHACDEFAKKTRNALFLPTKTFSLGGSFGGCGTLSYSEDRQLTARGENRSVWKLPSFLRNAKISYNEGGSYGFSADGERFNAARRGQEFVIRVDDERELEDWLERVIAGK